MSPNDTLSHLNFLQLHSAILGNIIILACVIFAIGLFISCTGYSKTIIKHGLIVMLISGIFIAIVFQLIPKSQLSPTQLKSLQSAPTKIDSIQTIPLDPIPNKNAYFEVSNSGTSYFTHSGNTSNSNDVPESAIVSFVSSKNTKQATNVLKIETFQYVNSQINKLVPPEPGTDKHLRYIFVKP